ncbi:VCBS repeat-containing protein [Lyngbya sp. CCY1209]|nr:VCBS repeat-containing protein [Lyngbya sp. CCY1209]
MGDIDVGFNSAPTFVDENGDGDLDLFIGANDGTIAVAHNRGTATAPDFDAPIVIRDVGNRSTPTFVDIDGDGDKDLFSGDTFGRIHFYRNRGSVSGASFEPPVINPFGISGGGGLSHPAFADIDGDGDADLFVGTATGTTLFFRNTGTPTDPNFVRGDNNPFGLTAVSGAAAPDFFDAENDGDLDAFIGTEDGTSTYFINLGTPTSPLFINTSTNAIANGASPDSAPPNPIQLPDNLPDVGINATPVLADINGDGFLDAFIGENNGTVNFVNGVIEGDDHLNWEGAGDELLDGDGSPDELLLPAVQLEVGIDTPRFEDFAFNPIDLDGRADVSTLPILADTDEMTLF